MLLRTYILFLGLIIYSFSFGQSTDKYYSKYAKCINANKIEKAQKYVQKGFDVNARDTNGKTPLLYSLQKGNERFARFFITNGANIELVDNAGNTCLHYAIENSSSAMVITLVENGADIAQSNKELYTPFHFSILFSCGELPFYFIDRETDYLAQTIFNEDALHLAAEAGCDSLVNYLLDKGIPYDNPDNRGNTPLYNALKYNSNSIAKQLISRGANINIESQDSITLLTHAIHHGNIEIVKLLIHEGIIIDHHRTDGSYLYQAANNMNKEIIEELLKYGVKNPMLCDVNDNCFKSAFIQFTEASLASDSLKINHFQSSKELFSSADQKYSKELSELITENAIIEIVDIVLMFTSEIEPSFYDSEKDYYYERINFIEERIKQCYKYIEKIETILN